MSILLFMALACAKDVPSPPQPVDRVEAVQEAETKSNDAPPLKLLQPLKTPNPITDNPESLYETCKVRVEGLSEAGECTTDADCVSVGCSSEVCVSTATAASGLNTTCEVLPCFSVLDSCGCIEGTCSWALKESTK